MHTLNISWENRMFTGLKSLPLTRFCPIMAEMVSPQRKTWLFVLYFQRLGQKEEGERMRIEMMASWGDRPLSVLELTRPHCQKTS